MCKEESTPRRGAILESVAPDGMTFTGPLQYCLYRWKSTPGIAAAIDAQRRAHVDGINRAIADLAWLGWLDMVCAQIEATQSITE